MRTTLIDFRSPSLDELSWLNIEFISFRESIGTGVQIGRAIIVIIGTLGRLERNMLIERARAGVWRARLESRRIGRIQITLEREGIHRNRCQSLRQITRSFASQRQQELLLQSLQT